MSKVRDSERNKTLLGNRLAIVTRVWGIKFFGLFKYFITQ